MPRSLAGGRYELHSVVGGGRTGVVYRAHDRALDRVVALKTLRRVDADALYRLKREFRTLTRLAHRNLVQFFDLHVEGDERFFTMELIDGVDFVEHFRGLPRDDDARRVATFAQLREAVAQLAFGLDALHRHGTLHRDVKPANVLLDGSGRVVLLDFGLASHFGPPDVVEPHAAGTMGYLAPEQLRGQGSWPASDWYALGVLLYETLTGQLPFDGAALLALIAGRGAPPPAPWTLAPDVPRDLASLALALLDVDPARRPAAAAVVASVTHEPQPVRGTLRPLALAPATGAPFVARETELATLLAALRDSRQALVRVDVVGVSGIGKTSLLERFALGARQTVDALVLTARCHPQESIPFKAVDGAIDDLARALATSNDSEVERLLPPGVGALRRVFPVLGRVPAVARAADRDGAELDPVYGRRRAFGALREVLRRVAASRAVVLWIDDLQWGDLDSAALLRDLSRSPDAPALLLVLSMTGEQRTTSPVVAALAGEAAGASAARRMLEVGPLADEQARRLAAAILGSEAAAGEAAEIAQAAQGSPLLVAELARHALARRSGGAALADARPLGVAEVVQARIEQLPQLARALLELVAVAGRPLSHELAHRAQREGEDLRPALALLAAQNLVRAVPSGAGVATTIQHQRIGEAVLELLPEARRRGLHAELAQSLAAQPDTDPRLLVDHYEQAGEEVRAAELALASAARAVAELAFNQAADLYRRALELGATSEPRWQMLARLGDSLTYAGRGAEGAASLAGAAAALRESSPGDALAAALERRAAEQYLRSGVYAHGLEVLRAVLDDAGISYPPSLRATLLSILWNRARLRLRAVLPGSARVTVRDRERLEIYWSAGVGLSLYDMVRAADFQLRHALLAHRVGEPRHLARALATEAMTVSWEGGGRNCRRSARLQAQALGLAAAADDPRIDVQTLLTRSAIAFVERRFREAFELCERGVGLCRTRHVGTTWETANFDLCAVSALACLGRLAELRERLRELQQQADERNDFYSSVSLRLGFPNSAWLAGDDPDEARRQIAHARAAGALTPFQEYSAVFAEAQVDLYAGDAFAGWQRTSAAWPVLRRAYLTRVQGIRIDLTDLRARCALRLATSERVGGRLRRRLLHFASGAARRIVRERVAWSGPMVAALRAALSTAAGDLATGAARLDEAERGYAALDMQAHAAAARLQAARLRATPAEVLAGHAFELAALGAKDPLRLAAMLVPLAVPRA